jgi:hypothetical protein
MRHQRMPNSIVIHRGLRSALQCVNPAEAQPHRTDLPFRASSSMLRERWQTTACWVCAAGDRRALKCYFLKRSLKARRGSSGRPDPDDVSRSTVARREKNVQSLRARLSEMRSAIGWLHSNRCPGAKWVHCWQACSSARHLGHWPNPSVNEARSVPQSVQRKTVRLGSIPGARVPDDPSGLPPLSFSDSRYPR